MENVAKRYSRRLHHRKTKSVRRFIEFAAIELGWGGITWEGKKEIKLVKKITTGCH